MMLNINQFIGQLFTAPSGNQGKLHRIAPGMLGVEWTEDPTVADAKAFETWFLREISADDPYAMNMIVRKVRFDHGCQ